MKTLYFKIISTFSFLLIVSCKAQQIYPLNTDYEDIPSDSYIKDLTNELNEYEGTYKANDQGTEIYLFITKQENKLVIRPGKQFYRDALIIKYIVKNTAGQILQDTKNINNPNIYINSYRTRPTKNTVILYYSGTNCGVGWGDIYLKKINNTQISWTYQADSTVITEQNCPGNPDLTVYLPKTENLIFTKQ
ncbi:hypothetical protein DBR39_03655 [Chryseobacterium sp. KBW03]|uniref:DUF6705 family protein n=1 Tax=Chryseobacterium sp. KBW03 TaxID=2153362 RepID=UPI000F5AF293|nr:DUF6705 family protein [Chryseobacterium sp. KBW03]RQO41720.1 hypothetical protein DBR39_03655 [Chryseobacterium sp. KBW03]